ncbi:Ribulosamine/erythrulosamine 3-kinase [Fulvivirga imtechensis AK7]|uniref:Ribulosamine/erythrulosamine 3-kinase n=1 Tax=Fulvivirga imtechensis AK7 TaxID=1237149 RepID=L8JLA5_9BACT|nr:fructosamine kinase family protein [Fulvivirga imtechensis]ELR69028.1 Ribulosamine/erythrulosamine 3-kinase [Fulvivirga imtechensis AK7]
MINSIPEEVRAFCEEHVGVLQSFTPASGGCINNGGRINGKKGELFLKWNSARRFPDMFTTEAKGLSELRKPNCITVPRVTDVLEGEVYSAILMEIISSGRRVAKYWENLAESIACLHKVTQEQFGLDHNNYIGSLPQNNSLQQSWVDFFIKNRLRPQLKMALDSGKMSSSDIRSFDELELKLPELLAGGAPSLIHGDLWSGNLMTDQYGAPAIVDPAVSFSHREIEMAFTQLFGGFDNSFYEAYQEIFPMEAGYQERFDIYNIYPLLVHVNLFGGGYYHQVMHLLKRFT